MNRVRDTDSALRSQAVSFSAYRDVVISTSYDVANMAEAARQACLKRLSGFEQYLTAQEGYLLMQKRASTAMAEELLELEMVTARLLDVSMGFAAMKCAGVTRRLARVGRSGSGYYAYVFRSNWLHREAAARYMEGLDGIRSSGHASICMDWNEDFGGDGRAASRVLRWPQDEGLSGE